MSGLPKTGCERGHPWLACLPGSIVCPEPSQEAGTGQASGSRTAPDTGLWDVSCESWAAGPWPRRAGEEQALAYVPIPSPSPIIRAWGQGERPASRVRVTSGQHRSRGKLASIAETWPTLKLPYCSDEETEALRGRASVVGGMARPRLHIQGFHNTLCLSTEVTGLRAMNLASVWLCMPRRPRTSEKAARGRWHCFLP